MYGSTLIKETDRPLDSRRAPIDAAAMPFPSEETTPPSYENILSLSHH